MAVNCKVVPLAADGAGGVTPMDCSVAAVTVRDVEPVTPFNAALTVAVPIATPVPSPLDPAASETVAMVESDELQVAWEVRSWVVPLE